MVKNHIKELRRERRITQAKLAEAIGASQAAVQKLENGIMDLDTKWMLLISQALNVKPYELLPLEWQPKNYSHNDDLENVIEIVETYLQNKKLSMKPANKAKLITILLEIIDEVPANENLKKEIEKTINMFTRIISA